MVRMLPRLLSFVRRALFLVTLSEISPLRDSIVVATMSETFGNAIVWIL
jgi:hypothetical protein